MTNLNYQKSTTQTRLVRMNPITLERIIKQALEEDLGMGDWSSQWLFDGLSQKVGDLLPNSQEFLWADTF